MPDALRGSLLVKDNSAYLSLVDLWKEREVELNEGTLSIKSTMTGRIKAEIQLKGAPPCPAVLQPPSLLSASNLVPMSRLTHSAQDQKK